VRSVNLIGADSVLILREGRDLWFKKSIAIPADSYFFSEADMHSMFAVNSTCR